MRRILIAGGSGNLGRALIQPLVDEGYEIWVVGRKKQEIAGAKNAITWEDMKTDAPECEIMINLSGANIFESSWTKDRKQILLSSRVDTTKWMAEAALKSKNPPSLIINGSAVGIYPTSETVEYNEDFSLTADPSDFTSYLCHQWENALKNLIGTSHKSIRTVFLRTGICLNTAPNSALSQMYTPFWYGLGGKIGSGNQYMSWIHQDDWIGILKHIIKTTALSGPVNAVAPNPVTNSEFSSRLAEAMHRPALFPLPSFVLSYIFGERAKLLLEGQKVIPQRALETGYQFKYPFLEDALSNLIPKM